MGSLPPPDRPGAERKVPFVPKALAGKGGSRPSAPPKQQAVPAGEGPRPPATPPPVAAGAPAAPAPAGVNKVVIKKSVADRIRQLNASGQLQGELKLAPLAKAFAALDAPSALAVLDSLIDSAPDCSNPTAWVCDVAASVAEEKGSLPADVPPAREEQEEQEPPAKVRRTEAGSSRRTEAGSSRAPLPPPPRPLPERQGRQAYERLPPPERHAPPALAALPAERRPEVVKYKTTICRHWERQGHCDHGAECRYAHGVRELRTKEMNTQDFLRESGGGDRPPLPRQEPPRPEELGPADDGKSEICRDFVRTGRCKFGQDCRFSHDVDNQAEEDLRSSSAPALPEHGGPRTSEICRDFERGICKFGSACRFSHDANPKPPVAAPPRASSSGPPDSRDFGRPEPDLPSKYKTMLCRHYERGSCQLGVDCQFAHGTRELRRPGMEQPPPSPRGTVLPPPPPPGGFSSQIPNGICRDFFRDGRCKFGRDCRFSHTEMGGSDGPLPPPDTRSADPQSELCKYFLRGTCELGEMCRFPHSLDEEKEEIPRGGNDICRDFLRGRCKFGNGCRFLHSDPPDSSGPGDAADPVDGSGRANEREDQEMGRREDSPPGHYKTTLCRHFERGYCELGLDCMFAHGAEELRSTDEADEPDDVYGEPVTERRGDAKPPREGLLGKLRPDQVEICVDYQRGLCKFGSSCRFIHNVEELGMKIARVPWTSGMGSNSHGPLLVSPHDSKGEPDICRDFVRGRCNFGRDCRFSHGQDERSRRPAPDWGRDGAPPPPPNVIPIKYKVEPCRHFDRGHCQLGDLCGYAHGDEEMRVGGTLSYLSGR